MFVETGGFGLMGKELSKIMKIYPLSHDDIEIRDKESVKKIFKKLEPELVVHLAAFVNVEGCEKNKDLAYETNVIGTRNVSKEAKTLYISTDYVFDGEKGNYSESDRVNPLNYYGLTKLLGEYETLLNGGKVLRLSFKPRPYKHPRVPKEMSFSGGYVDEMAKEIKWATENFDKLQPLTHVGLKKISLLDLAKQTRNVEEMSIDEISVRIPRDVSFNLQLWNKTKCQRD